MATVTVTMPSRFAITKCAVCGGSHPKGTEITKRRGSWVPVSCVGGTPTTTTRRNATTRRARAEANEIDAMERNAAALERAMAARGMRVVPPVVASKPVPSECAECGGTKLGDDGFECATCSNGPGIGDLPPSDHNGIPDHVADFGPMPPDDGRWDEPKSFSTRRLSLVQHKPVEWEIETEASWPA